MNRKLRIEVLISFNKNLTDPKLLNGSVMCFSTTFGSDL